MKTTGIFVVLALSIIFFTSTSTSADEAVPAAIMINLEPPANAIHLGKGWQIPKGKLLINTWPNSPNAIFFELNVGGCPPKRGTEFYTLYISSPSLGVKRLYNFNTVSNQWTFHTDITTAFHQAYFNEELHVWVQVEVDNGVDDGVNLYRPILVGYSQ